MLFHKPNPVDSATNLRKRVSRLLGPSEKQTKISKQPYLDQAYLFDFVKIYPNPRENITAFLNYISSSVPDGDVYLFGGVLRDLAIFGRSGFNSDVDLVVEGDWSNFVSYLQYLNAKQNKFGGYRLTIGNIPVDIWHAEETWAIKQNLVKYRGVASLIDTTVLNWDAILMNWRTGAFIHRTNYFDEISARKLDIVLKENPNNLGMAVRVFRHLSLKDAKKITASAAEFLAKCANVYAFEELNKYELYSYRNAVIEPILFKFFKEIDISDERGIEYQFSIASSIIEKELALR